MGTEGGARGAVWRAGSLAVGFIGGACAMLGLGGPSSSVQPVYRPTRDVHAEYIKYASGTDSITAYLAYPERARYAVILSVPLAYLMYSSGTDSITAYLAYPERADPAPAVQD